MPLPPSNIKQKGSGFTNLNKVLNASANSKLGTAVGGGVSGQVTQANAARNVGKSQFQEESEKGRLDTDANKANVAQTLGNIQAGQATNVNDDQAKEWEKFRTAGYAGPNSIANAGKIQSQAHNAEQLGQATGTAEGRMGLLQNFAAAKNKGYGQGASRLDTVLLGQQGGNQLRQARRQATGLENRAVQDNKTAAEQAALLENRAREFNVDTAKKIDETFNPINTNVTEATKAAQDKLTADTERAKQQLAGGMGIDSDLYDELGLDTFADRNTYGLNLADDRVFNAKKASDLNAQNIADQTQTAQLNALNRLAGKNAFSSDPSIAGTGTKNRFTLNNEDLNKLLQQKEQDVKGSEDWKKQNELINQATTALSGDINRLAADNYASGDNKQAIQDILNKYNAKYHGAGDYVNEQRTGISNSLDDFGPRYQSAGFNVGSVQSGPGGGYKEDEAATAALNAEIQQAQRNFENNKINAANAALERLMGPRIRKRTQLDTGQVQQQNSNTNLAPIVLNSGSR